MKSDSKSSKDKRIHVSFGRHGKYSRPIIYLIMLILSVVLVSNRGGAFFYVFFYGMIIYLPISFLYLVYVAYSIRISQELDERLFRKGTDRTYKLIIENAGLLPVGSISLLISDTAATFRECFTDRLYSLMPHEVIRLDNVLFCRYAGSYEIGISDIQIRDPFKIIEVTYKVSTPLRVSVLPQVTDIAVTDINKIYSDMGLKAVGIDEDFLGNDLRKYMPGDSRNTIHWKTYARTKKLYVRLPEKKTSQMLSLVIIKDSILPGEEGLIRRDYFLEYIVSIMNYFARNRKPLEIVYYDSGVKSCIIDGYDSFQKAYYDVIRRIISKPMSDEETGLADIKENVSSRKLVIKEKDMVICQS